MIELTTGIALLMSSLYGSGQVNAQTYSIPADITADDIAEEVAADNTRSFIDSIEVEKYVKEKTKDMPLLVDIARCESRFLQYHKDGTIVRGRANHADVGVFQINEKYHAETARKLGFDLYTLEGNVAYGKYLYGKYDSRPWSASEKCWTLAEGPALANK